MAQQAHPLVAFFGTYDADAHPRVRVLAEGLAANGCDIVELNTPLGFDTAQRVQLARQPWRAPAFAMRVLRSWWRLVAATRRFRRTPQGRSVAMVVVGYMGQFDVHVARAMFSSPIALDYMVGLGDTAADRGAPALLTRVLQWIDRRAVAAADITIFDTSEQAERCSVPTERVVVAVGAPIDWYADEVAPSLDDNDGLSVVFYGLYTPLQGTPVIGDAIASLSERDDIRFTMIGTGQDRAECERRAGAGGRVRWIDWLDTDDLIAEVARHDVCLGIFGTSPKAFRVVPNKVYQGAAAGCAVVTSDTPPQRSNLGEAALLCPPGDPMTLADAVRALADDPDALRSYRHRARMLADRFRPDAIVTPLLARVGTART